MLTSADSHAALKRKGKDDGVTEDDMDSVVAAHNCKCRFCTGASRPCGLGRRPDSDESAITCVAVCMSCVPGSAAEFPKHGYCVHMHEAKLTTC